MPLFEGGLSLLRVWLSVVGRKCILLIPDFPKWLRSVSALLPPLLEGVSERSEQGVWTQCVGQVAHFNLTPETSFMLMVLICYHSCCQVLQLNLTTQSIAQFHNKLWHRVKMRNALGP